MQVPSAFIFTGQGSQEPVRTRALLLLLLRFHCLPSQRQRRYRAVLLKGTAFILMCFHCLPFLIQVPKTSALHLAARPQGMGMELYAESPVAAAVWDAAEAHLMVSAAAVHAAHMDCPPTCWP